MPPKENITFLNLSIKAGLPETICSHAASVSLVPTYSTPMSNTPAASAAPVVVVTPAHGRGKQLSAMLEQTPNHSPKSLIAISSDGSFERFFFFLLLHLYHL